MIQQNKQTEKNSTCGEREKAHEHSKMLTMMNLMEGLFFYSFDFSMGLKFFKRDLGANHLFPRILQLGFRNIKPF